MYIYIYIHTCMNIYNLYNRKILHMTYSYYYCRYFQYDYYY